LGSGPSETELELELPDPLLEELLEPLESDEENSAAIHEMGAQPHDALI
jgi:hypothetical protein